MLVISAGCTNTVELTVKNETNQPITPKIILKDENGTRSQNGLSLGVLNANEQASITFEAKPNSTFEVAGFTNAKIATSNSITVLSKPDPFQKSVTLRPTAKVIDDSTSLETISQSFKKLGTDLGAYPLPLNTALKTTIGSLVVAERGSDNAPGKIYLTIPPNVFGVKQLTLEDVPKIPTEEISETEISGTGATSASGQYTALAGFDTGFKSDSVYRLKWFLSGFGVMKKIEDPSKNPAKMFNELDVNYLNQIKSTLRRYPKSKIYYINSYYVLNNARLTIKEARKADMNADMDAIVVNGNTAYTFNNTQEQHKSFGPVVLNYWGDEYDLIEIANPLKNVTTISGTPKTSVEATRLLVPTSDQPLLIQAENEELENTENLVVPETGMIIKENQIITSTAFERE